MSVTTSSVSSLAPDPRFGAARQHAVAAIGHHVGRALLLAAPRRRCTASRPNRRCRRSGCSNAPSTSPMMFITSDSPAFSRRLSTIASGALSSRLARLRARTTPPTSGDTTIRFLARIARLDVRRHHRRGIQIVGRNVEEALDLPGVEIHRQHAVGARGGDHVGDQLGRDRRARPGFAVLPGIAEIRDDRGDPLGRRALAAHRCRSAIPSDCRWSGSWSTGSRTRPRRGHSRGSRRTLPRRRSGARWPWSAACRDNRRSPGPAAGCELPASNFMGGVPVRQACAPLSQARGARARLRRARGALKPAAVTQTASASPSPR